MSEEKTKASAFGVVAKGIGAVLVALVLAVVAIFGLVHFKFGPKNMPLKEASKWTTVGPDDEVLHAYYGVRWLDSQRYFVIRPPRETIDSMFEGVPEIDPKYPEDYVFSGGPMHGKHMWSPGESLPGWWDVAEQPVILSRDTRTSGRHDGETRIYSKENGLIYVIDR